MYYTSSEKCGISYILPSEFSIQNSCQILFTGFSLEKYEYTFMLLIHVVPCCNLFPRTKYTEIFLGISQYLKQLMG